MDKSLSERIGLYFESLPPPTGRTFHQMQPETLLSECRTTIDLQGSVIIGYQNRIAELEKARDGAYTERNRLVALLATLFPSGTKKTAIPGWDEEWHGCVYIDLPVGQASWHYHDSEAYLFAHLPPYEGEWDGHTTEEKYERISLAANHIKQTDELLADYIKFSNALMIQTDNQNKRIKQLETALRDISVIAPLAQSSDIARAALAGEKKDG